MPPEYRLVLVQTRPSLDGQSAAVAVGYVKNMSEGPVWIVPGVGRGGGIHAWADCLGDDFRADVWPGTAPGSSLDNAQHRAAGSAAGGQPT